MFNQIENFIPSILADEIETYFTSSEMKWEHKESTVKPETLDSLKVAMPQYDIVDNHLFFHPIFNGSPMSPAWDVVKPLLYFFIQHTKLNVIEVERIKANLLVPNGSKPESFNAPHYDSNDHRYTSFIYYVNNSDGDTIGFTNKNQFGKPDLDIIDRKTPRKGSGIYFPSNYYHTSSNPIECNSRIILNFVFRIER